MLHMYTEISRIGWFVSTNRGTRKKDDAFFNQKYMLREKNKILLAHTFQLIGNQNDKWLSVDVVEWVIYVKSW